MSIAKLPLTVKALASEPLLIAAWKKAEAYIRQHNWYADVLALDRTNVDLENVIQGISREIKSTPRLQPNPLRLVLAPKSQGWEINDDNQWGPAKDTDAQKRLRPLAHVTVRDQIIAMAFAILFADTVETRLGDPLTHRPAAGGFATKSYGNRLMCDVEGKKLRFRWGSSTSYRKYFQDYRAFVARPRVVVAEKYKGEKDWAIVQADLSQFYDRVRPTLLHDKIKSVVGSDLERGLLERFESFFNWHWDDLDREAALAYAGQANPEINGFEDIALPQGLVASGFFANAVLINFDRAVLKDIQPVDYCRYVDDMRFVVRVEDGEASAIKENISKTLCGQITQCLNQYATGLALNTDKVKVMLGSEFPNGERPLAAMMERIAHNTSGVVDLFLAEETLDTLDNLLPAEQEPPAKFGGAFRETFPEVTPDVQDATVARFSAQRFRNLFRRSRPMCEDEESGTGTVGGGISRQYLDQKASHFSRRLIERWICDPSNIRLLRVALDLRPDPKVLELIIDLLSRHLGKKAKLDDGATIVATYCAAELLKAGATETGNVADTDQLPADCGIDKVKEYRNLLARFAESCEGGGNPWYLRQQASLFLRLIPEVVATGGREEKRNEEFSGRGTPAQVAMLKHHYESVDIAAEYFVKLINAGKPGEAKKSILAVLKEDSELAEAVWEKCSPEQRGIWRAEFIAHGHCREKPPDSAQKMKGTYNLVSLGNSKCNPFQQEYAALRLALKLLSQISSRQAPISPAAVFVSANDWAKLQYAEFPIADDAFRVEFRENIALDSRFTIPDWVNRSQMAGYQLGQLLRVVLTGRSDYTLPIKRQQRGPQIKTYRPYRSAWLLRKYGMFNGRTAFGPDWLPISSWFGSLLARLLEWPGFDRQDSEVHLPDSFRTKDLETLITDRIRKLEALYGRSSRVPLLPVTLSGKFSRKKRGVATGGKNLYRMRVAVVQTAFPSHESLREYPQLQLPETRRSHRRHLSAVLGGVRRMLQVRSTHHSDTQGIDLLVLPELAVHQDDVRTILTPFARQHNCMIFAGVVFHALAPDGGLVNVAQWILSVRSASGSLRLEGVMQGKCHLTEEENKLNVVSFRPAQWVFEFTSLKNKEPSWSMTGSICYDATDLCLAADLRDRTDLFVVPALNRDVGTFDNMVAALHYHMYQHVIVANAGGYGGSTAQAPFENRNDRTIFHTHGGGHVTISFFDIDLKQYCTAKGLKKHKTLKTPPAGYKRRQ